MKCPLCQAPTDINETRQVDGTVLRRRECYNMHVFSTQEIVVKPPRPKRIYKLQANKPTRT